MIGSTVQYHFVGTKCLSLITHIRQPVGLLVKPSVCYASQIFNKLSLDYSNYNCISKGSLTTYEHSQTILHPECTTALVSLHKFPSAVNYGHRSVSAFSRTCLLSRNFATDGSKPTEQSQTESSQVAEPEKLSLLQRFKQMYRDYWYVLVPVHVITSLGWFAGFYYLAKSGVDVIALLERMSVSDKLINPLRDSSAGYIALAYALYKIATPVRYFVTLGGTTVSINYLQKWGWIKPIPPREKLKEMYQEKKAMIRGTTEEFKLQQEKLKETGKTIMRGYREQANKPEK